MNANRRSYITCGKETSPEDIIKGYYDVSNNSYTLLKRSGCTITIKRPEVKDSNELDIYTTSVTLGVDKILSFLRNDGKKYEVSLASLIPTSLIIPNAGSGLMFDPVANAYKLDCNVNPCNYVKSVSVNNGLATSPDTAGKVNITVPIPTGGNITPGASAGIIFDPIANVYKLDCNVNPCGYAKTVTINGGQAIPTLNGNIAIVVPTANTATPNTLVEGLAIDLTTTGTTTTVSVDTSEFPAGTTIPANLKFVGNDNKVYELPKGAGFTKQEFFKTAGPGTWTAPAGVTTIKFTIIGGGGGGAVEVMKPDKHPNDLSHPPGFLVRQLRSAEGGQSGARVTGYFTTVPGTVYNFQVGEAGSNQAIGIVPIDTYKGMPGLSGEATYGFDRIASGGLGAIGFSSTSPDTVLNIESVNSMDWNTQTNGLPNNVSTKSLPGDVVQVNQLGHGYYLQELAYSEGGGGTSFSRTTVTADYSSTNAAFGGAYTRATYYFESGEGYGNPTVSYLHGQTYPKTAFKADIGSITIEY